MTSEDGLDFKFCKMLVEPAVINGKNWMQQFVYASHLVRTGNSLRLYFNARDISHPLCGRECIGFAEAEIGYSIAADFRGRGYGHKILQLINQKVHDELPQIKQLVAKVKPENTASKKLFENEGYEMKYTCFILDSI